MSQSNFFTLFSLPVRFELNRSELDQSFRQMQAVFHPDKFAAAVPADQRKAAEQSMNINEAYQTLKDPLNRAMHLCKLNGFDAQLHTNTAMPLAFLMEQMQLRESLELARSATDPADSLDALQGQVDLAQRSRLAQLNDQIDIHNNFTNAVALVRELMFFRKLGQEIDDALSLT